MRFIRRKVIALTALIIVLAFAGIAFAFTSGDWEPRANKWQSAACTEATLKSKESLATNQKIAICYALARAQEDKATIATLQSQVAQLEANQTPPPKDIGFFDHYEGSTEVSSSTFDATGYNTINVLTDLTPTDEHLSLEVSNDGTTWSRERDYLTSGATEPFAVVGRYYRVTIRPNQPGPYHVTVLGHFKP